MKQELLRTLIKHRDICAEIMDAVFSVHLTEHDHIIHPVEDDYNKGLHEIVKDVFVDKRDILVPDWCFDTNTLEDLERLDYIIKNDKGDFAVTLKGVRLASSFVFYHENQQYKISCINHQDAIDLLIKELNIK